jgi:hypothetical protein
MITAYFAASVRGPLGDEATLGDRQINITAAIEKAHVLEKTFPELDIYVPHKDEKLWEVGYETGNITAQDIIDHCLAIVRRSDLFIMASNPDESDGVKQEYAEAVKYGKAVVPVYSSPVSEWPELIKAGMFLANLNIEIAIQKQGCEHGESKTDFGVS